MDKRPRDKLPEVRETWDFPVEFVPMRKGKTQALHAESSHSFGTFCTLTREGAVQRLE